eukprot:SAG22_NODE_207_length_15278_cov_4.056855_5_plen_232_part_00
MSSLRRASRAIIMAGSYSCRILICSLVLRMLFSYYVCCCMYMYSYSVTMFIREISPYPHHRRSAPRRGRRQATLGRSRLPRRATTGCGGSRVRRVPPLSHHGPGACTFEHCMIFVFVFVWLPVVADDRIGPWSEAEDEHDERQERVEEHVPRSIFVRASRQRKHEHRVEHHLAHERRPFNLVRLQTTTRGCQSGSVADSHTPEAHTPGSIAAPLSLRCQLHPALRPAREKK